MKLTYYSEVKDGKLRLLNNPNFLEGLKSFEGKRIEVTIENVKKKRSNQQNRYYFGCVIPIIKNHLKELGNDFTSEQIHDILKFRFLKEIVPLSEEEYIERIKSTTELTTSQFMDFKAEIQKWCAETFDLYIPDPQEQIQVDYEN